ncbi:MAG TPA: SRPBCC domain-containing protein, partial [Streptosporangiaceae bacterium]|nr:SRPBCC domain-containing protein [Streptosporangiaceae bacterium]
HDHEVPPGATRVVITLQAENGGTRVILRHYDLPDGAQRDHHRKGWDFYLERLSARIRGEDPGPDPNT